MFNRLRQQAGDEGGFTLIELLVVILIIGILAAIAIPSFLNQKNKANDASAKELARTAETAAETYATDHSGSYSGLSVSALVSIEPTIATSSAGGNAYVSAATPDGSAQGYTVTAVSTDGNSFSIIRADTGTTSRSCAVGSGNAGGCVNDTW